jgi:hypothetical protein
MDVAWALVIAALIHFFVTVALFGGAIGWASVVLLGLAVVAYGSLAMLEITRAEPQVSRLG